jgi:hypothetical protein
MDRILAGTGSKVRITNYDTNGDPADAGGGNGTAVVTDSAGAAAPGSPYTAVRVSTGTYEVTLSATLTVLDVYDVDWTLPDTTHRSTQFELVRTFLFAVADLQALDSVLANETDFPIPTLVNARENAEQRFEEVADVSFTTRGARLRLDGNGRYNRNGDGFIGTGLQELQRVISCSVDGTALTGPQLAELVVYRHGTIIWPATRWVLGAGNISMLVEHGYSTVPEPVRRAGLLYARTVLIRSAMEQSDRATAVFTELGGYRLTLAGRDGPTGLPDVDAILAQFGRRPAGSFA